MSCGSSPARTGTESFSHYIDVIMTTVASQITSLTVVYSTVYSRRSKKTPKLRVTGLSVGNSPGPVNSPHKGLVTRQMFPFDDVIMQFSWHSIKTMQFSGVVFRDSMIFWTSDWLTWVKLKSFSVCKTFFLISNMLECGPWGYMISWKPSFVL